MKVKWETVTKIIGAVIQQLGNLRLPKEKCPSCGATRIKRYAARKGYTYVCLNCGYPLLRGSVSKS